MTNKTIDDRLTQICDYVQGLLNVPVLKSRHSFTPQMKTSFITVSFNSLEPVYKDRVDLLHQKEDNELLTQRVRGLLYVDVLFQAYGKDAFQLLNRLKMSFSSSTFSYWCSQFEFGFTGSSNMEDVSAVLLDSNYERRCQLSANFYVCCPENFDIEWFNKEHLTVMSKDVAFEQDIPEREEE